MVTAGFAWPRYNDRSIYGDIRRPNWKPSAHLAFYTQGEIKPIVPRIKSTVSPLNIMNQEEVKALENYQKKVVRELIDNAVKNEDFNHSLRMLFLTGPEDNDTVRLEGGPIVNDKTSDKTGKRVPLMYGGVRYVTLESLKKRTLYQRSSTLLTYGQDVGVCAGLSAQRHRTETFGSIGNLLHSEQPMSCIEGEVPHF